MERKIVRRAALGLVRRGFSLRRKKIWETCRGGRLSAVDSGRRWRRRSCGARACDAREEEEMVKLES